MLGLHIHLVDITDYLGWSDKGRSGKKFIPKQFRYQIKIYAATSQESLLQNPL